MPLSHYALEKFVGQEVSRITECNAAALAEEFPEHASWLSNFVLTSMFRQRLAEGKAALALSLIRRAEAAVEDYEEARDLLTGLASGPKTVSGYFRCLRKFESAVAMAYQALDLSRKALGQLLFQKSDGSPYQRLNVIYNKSRHADPESLPPGHLHVVWITNEGLCTEGACLAFDELREVVSTVARIADRLSSGNP